MAKRKLGEVYVKLDGAITQISKLNQQEFEVFLAYIRQVDAEYQRRMNLIKK